MIVPAKVATNGYKWLQSSILEHVLQVIRSAQLQEVKPADVSYDTQYDGLTKGQEDDSARKRRNTSLS